MIVSPVSYTIVASSLDPEQEKMDTERFRAYTATYFERDVSRRQFVEEVSSISHESRRIADPFVLILTAEGKLYSPSHKCLIETIIDETAPLGKTDKAALVKIQEIVAREKSGTIVWVSQAFGENEVPKVIAYEIRTVNERKIIFGHSVLVDTPKQNFIEAANRLAQCAGELPRSSGIELRRTPIFLKEMPIHWTFQVGGFLESKEWFLIRTKEVWKTKRETLRRVSMLYEYVQRGVPPPHYHQLFGENPLSCPPRHQTGFDSLFNMMRRERNSFTGNCPLCGTYNRDLKPGDRCKGCNEVYEGCGSGGSEQGIQLV